MLARGARSADGTANVVTRSTSLDRYPIEVADRNGHIEVLVTVLASFGKHIRYAIGQATDLLDKVVLDLVVQSSIPETTRLALRCLAPL